MPEWYEVAAGLPDFTGAAGSWFDRMYGVRRQQTQDQAAKDAAAAKAKEKENALLTKTLMEEDARLRNAISGRAKQDRPIGAGKGVNLDKTPWQMESSAYQQEARGYKPPEPAFDELPEIGKPSGEETIQRQVREIAPSESRKAAIEARYRLASKLHGPEFADLIRRRDEAQLEPELAEQKKELEAELRSQSYYAAHPERTVPVLAGKVRAAGAEAKAEKERQALKRSQTAAGPAHRRITVDEQNRLETQAAQEAQQQKYAEKLDNLEKMRNIIVNTPEGQGFAGIPTLGEIDALIAQTKREGIAYASPALPVKPEAQQATWGKALVESQKAEKAGQPKPFDTKAQGLKTLDKQIGQMRQTVEKAKKEMRNADAEASERALNQMVDEYTGLGGVGQTKQFTAVNVTQADLQKVNSTLKSGERPFTADEIKAAKLEARKRAGQ